MKKKDLAELHQKTYEELARSLQETKLNLAKMKLDLEMRKSMNTGIVYEMRKDIARITTIMEGKKVKEEKHG